MDATSGDPERAWRFIKAQDWSANAILRRYPATIAIGAVVAAVGFFTLDKSRAEMSAYMARFGLTWASLTAGRLWTMPISTVMQSDPGFPWLILFFSLASLFALETLAGTLAALVTFVAADWISSPLTAVALRVLAALHDRDAQRLLTVGSTGSSAAFHGCFAAAAMLLPKRWADRCLVLLAGNVVVQFFYERLDDAVAHAIATLVGVLLAQLLWTRQPPAAHG